MAVSTADMEVTEELVTDAEREDFVQRGFFTVKALAAPDEVVLIKSELMRLMQDRVGINHGALTDLVAPDGEPSVSPQMFDPSNYAPMLRRTRHRARCLEIARSILGPDAKLAFEQMIYKPAGKGAATPWHQDDAFTTNADCEVPQISIWMALQDVSQDNGCLRYVASSNLGPLYPHRSPGGDGRVHGLEIVPGSAPEYQPTYVPLGAGDCVVHHSRTIHGAGENRSGRERMAYILAFDGPPKRREGPLTYSWHEGRLPGVSIRRRRWLAQGGVLVLLWRKMRDGRFNDPRRIGYKIGRFIRQLVAARKS